ncbi:MAG: hypothetical protein JKY65_09330 [Planctomycetes bacterium]|nr:hypothetical protein [Planctomycetota bacterium]
MRTYTWEATTRRAYKLKGINDDDVVAVLELINSGYTPKDATKECAITYTGFIRALIAWSIPYALEE